MCLGQRVLTKAKVAPGSMGSIGHPSVWSLSGFWLVGKSLQPNWLCLRWYNQNQSTPSPPNMPSQTTLGCYQACEATDKVLIPRKGEEQEQILLSPDLVLAHLSESDIPQGLLEDMRSHCAQSVAKDDKLPGFWSLQDFYPPLLNPDVCQGWDKRQDTIFPSQDGLEFTCSYVDGADKKNSCPSASTFKCWDCWHEPSVIPSFEHLAFNTKGISTGSLAHFLLTPKFWILVPSKEI